MILLLDLGLFLMIEYKLVDIFSVNDLLKEYLRTYVAQNINSGQHKKSCREISG